MGYEDESGRKESDTPAGEGGRDVDLAAALGSDAGVSTQCFAVYIPNKDCNGDEIGNQRRKGPTLMARRIRPSEPTLQGIRDTSISLPPLSAADVQRALGADAPGERLEGLPAPISLLAVREELFRRLQSTGGRPALSGVTRRVKVPLRDEEWQRLQDIARDVSHRGFAPTAGQVASTILTTFLHSATANLASNRPPELPGDLDQPSTRRKSQKPLKT